jgi:hypothetical protein
MFTIDTVRECFKLNLADRVCVLARINILVSSDISYRDRTYRDKDRSIQMTILLTRTRAY